MKVIGLYSHDRTLYPLLSSALGSEFCFHLESTRTGIEHLVAGETCPVVLLDLRSTYNDVDEFVEFAQELVDSGVTLIVLADDGQRMKANELVSQGAFGYCRVPPSLRELRILLRRACELTLDADPDETSNTNAGHARDRHHMVGTSEPMQQVHSLIDLSLIHI